jgi:hypothetical protein
VCIYTTFSFPHLCPGFMPRAEGEVYTGQGWKNRQPSTDSRMQGSVVGGTVEELKF